MKGDGRLVGYTEGPELVLECGRCGDQVELLFFNMSGHLHCTVNCRCPCGGCYRTKGRISSGALGDGGPRAR